MKIAVVIPTFNEEDIIYHVIKYLVDQNIHVHILDNESTDSTVEVVKRFGDNVAVSSFSTEGEFNEKVMGDNIRQLIEMYEKDYDWVARINADEFWEAPFEGITLREGIEKADREGYNAIGVKQFRFYPMSDETPHVAGEDVREFYDYFEDWEGNKYLDETFHPEWNKIWIINMFKSNSGLVYQDAHLIKPLSNLKLFPHIFISRHYPYRNNEATRKRLIDGRKKRIAQWNKDNKVSCKYLEYKDDEIFLFDDMRDKFIYGKEIPEREVDSKIPMPTNLFRWSEFKKKN